MEVKLNIQAWMKITNKIWNNLQYCKLQIQIQKKKNKKLSMQ